MTSHLVIPDTQAKAGVPVDHLGWIGEYIAEKQPDVIIHLGDHWDMPSLSVYDKGKIQFEGRRYDQDVEAGNAALKLLQDPTDKLNQVRRRGRRKLYKPRKRFLRGNHEGRIERTIEDNPILEGKIGYQDLDTTGWEVHDFLEPVELDGVWYSHYWYQPMTGRPYTGTIDNRLKNVGHSFTMGHQQTLMYGLRFVSGRSQHGLVAGACYLHNEEYKGPQGNAHWRGIIVKQNVRDGEYSPWFVDLDYLCRRYEGVSLDRFTARRF